LLQISIKSTKNQSANSEYYQNTAKYALLRTPLAPSGPLRAVALIV
jgi:hypothetical protein